MRCLLRALCRPRRERRCPEVFKDKEGCFILVLCNRYDFPIVEFKMARRQGATREHVHCDLRPRSNAGAGPFSTQPSGPQFFGRISEKNLARPVSQRIQALRLLLEIRPSSLRRLASHTCYTTLETRKSKSEIRDKSECRIGKRCDMTALV